MEQCELNSLMKNLKSVSFYTKKDRRRYNKESVKLFLFCIQDITFERWMFNDLNTAYTFILECMLALTNKRNRDKIKRLKIS